MRLYALHVGNDKGDMAVFDPFHPDVGTKVASPWFSYLIQHPEGNVLFDTGAHPDLVTDPHKRLGAMADTFNLHLQPGDDVVSQLARIGLSPRDVEHVAHSHLHFDHAGGIEFFPDATFYVQHAELSFAYWPPVYQRAIYLKPDFDHPVRWKGLNGEYDVFGDGRVVLFPTPGHTAGHQSMLVRLKSQTIILAADAAYLPWNMEQRVLPAIVWSPDAMVASWERIEDLQRLNKAQLIITHDIDYKTKTRVAPEQWYE